jgi:phosphoesterase RecJ-like protein
MMTSEEVIASKRNFDYIIILDTSSLDRVGASKEVLGLDGVKVVIDHHKTNSYFGDINIVEPVSSVGELLYNLFSQMNQTLNQEMAKGLYTSIVTDTGEFRYSNTEASTLRAVATLIETGFDFGKVSQEIFSNIPKKKMLLQSHAISLGNSYFNDKVFVSKVTQDMIQSLECEMFHSDGIVEMGRDIEGVEVSILLKEVDNATVKVSMRSKSYVDVSEVSLVFSGGGHARAAGCTVNEPIDQVEKKLIDLFKGLV